MATNQDYLGLNIGQFRALEDILSSLQNMQATGTKTASQVNVNTAAVQLAAAGARKELRITNLGANTIFIGIDATVTAATGYPIKAGAEYIDKSSNDAVYAIASTGPNDVRILTIS